MRKPFSKKALQLAGMLANNVNSWEIVLKMDIWPKSEASRENLKFEDNLSAKDIISWKLPASQKGFFFF